MPQISFKVYDTPEKTLMAWSQQLNYMFDHLDAVYNVTLGNKSIKDFNIDFGTNPSQVSAADIPITDTGSLFTATNVETALAEAKENPVLGTDVVKETNIDFGTGAGQVSAADIPIADSAGHYTATDVEIALKELFEKVIKNTAVGTALPTALVATDLDTAAKIATQLNATNTLLNQLRQALINVGICI